ncbi:MAG: acylase [Pseudomonadota bacterium]
MPYRVCVLFVLLLCALATGCATSVPGGEFERLQARAQNVTIIRDDFGVPHVYARTDADAVFGMLYAQSEDDFARVEQNYIWAMGRLAEVEGKAALYSDLRARLYMTIDEAKAAYASAPAWLQALCDAYADGINYYLATHPETQPRLLTHFEPWFVMFFSEGSIGGDIESVAIRGIEAFYGAEAPQEVAQRAPSAASVFSEPKGSNGFAIAGEHTASGDAMLLINPHTSFFFRGEMHVVSEEGLNAYGAVTWGQFFIYQGFNEHTGWMHTSTRVDFMDEFMLDVAQRDGVLSYRYGDEWRPLRVSTVTLDYKDGDAIAQRAFEVYHSHHGPVTHLTDGRWTVTRLNWDPVNALHQSFVRTKQTGHEGFRAMMDIRTNSSNNTVYADSAGNIAYYHGNFIPRRDPSFDYSRPVDGSNPATDWQGLHTVDEIITLLNPPNGWIQNCNSTPFTAAGAFSPRAEDFPVYMAPDPENFRAIHAVRVLQDIDALTLDGLIEIAYDPYLPAFEQLIPGLIDALDEQAAAKPAVVDASAVLRNWDFAVSSESVAMTLAHFYALRSQTDGKLPASLKDASRMEKLNYFASDAPAAERAALFGDTVQMLIDDFGRWDIAWGAVNRYQRINGNIRQAFNDDAPSLPVGMASGNWGALASFGARRYPGTRKIYGTAGNSFVAVVEFGDRVRAKSLLAGGQSGDPDSPHFDDQAQRYVDVEFKDVAYYREDVEARAKHTYRPGERWMH